MLAAYDSNLTVCDYLRVRKRNASLADGELLERAKKGLRSLTFFGLKEFQQESRALFRHTFNKKLAIVNQKGLVNSKSTKMNKTESILTALHNSTMLAQIRNLNHLDMKLYDYAVDLFFQRLRHFNVSSRKI